MVGKGAKITKEVLTAHFHLPMSEVAKKFNVCITYFKKVCRSHGVQRWPHRSTKLQFQRKTDDEGNAGAYVDPQNESRMDDGVLKVESIGASKASLITKEALEEHFHLPMVVVARKFNVCLTYFKKMCRSHGVKQWPYRQVSFKCLLA